MHHGKFCQEFYKYVHFILHWKNSIFFALFIYTVSREIFAPPFFRPETTSYKPFHPGCPKANSNSSNYLSLNQTLFWANSRRAKPFAGKEIKINRGENNPVYITVILGSNVSASHCQHVSCNGGHCLSKDQSYICICPVGYDGRNCQHKGKLFDSYFVFKQCLVKFLVNV